MSDHKAGVQWTEKASPGQIGACCFTSGSTVSRPKTTIRLRDLYDPQPEPVKPPVRIRPPSPRPPPPTREPVFGRSLSCDPPTKPAMRRRAQSLPPSTDRRRRNPGNLQVRFVDSLGFELEHVKVFKVGEVPLIPPHVITRLLMSSEVASGKPLELSLPYFKPCFPDNMAGQPGFPERLRSQRVCLEQVLCSEVGIIGTAQVLNLAFEKEVTVHYSFTNWRSRADTKACWVSSLPRTEPEPQGPETDIFRFRLPVPPFILQPGSILEFAVCYRVGGWEYWDNNQGRNYKLSCHSYKLTVPRECEDSMVHFT